MQKLIKYEMQWKLVSKKWRQKYRTALRQAISLNNEILTGSVFVTGIVKSVFVNLRESCLEVNIFIRRFNLLHIHDFCQQLYVDFKVMRKTFINEAMSLRSLKTSSRSRAYRDSCTVLDSWVFFRSINSQNSESTVLTVDTNNGCAHTTEVLVQKS